MSSRLTMILAGLFLLGALVAGYWGIVLSKPAAPAPVPVVVEPAAPVEQKTAAAPVPDLMQTVVVLAHDISPNTALVASDLTLEKVRIAPPGSFSTADKALGRSTWRALPAGTWLSEDAFSIGGPLARMIHPDERALAVAVDEVIGAAGQFTPGDYVDVMLYLRQDQSNPLASAQVVVPAVRVLSIGDQVGLANDGHPAVPGSVDDKNRRSARTVVLAVPQGLVSRLMLAATSGTLRLAVRSAEENRLAHYWAGQEGAGQAVENTNRQLLQFNQLAMSNGAPQHAEPGAAPARRGMEVIRGNQVNNQANAQTP
ncbi:Flp pilus assembly protein CpaB [Pseudomonas sp. M47T1]|uniref:Flp pilus assembly protein CpaB n=1 Tax=unclassified Pseudomonas TaxID=196821 RepID=UPI00026085CB|nr:Flp pilus assembly protein CpaB [Pseudomonas sp. M47T1]EIK96541.1 Flp pilus assembly protein CpaB [Pseudomonas sp. M47T1]